MLLSGTEKKPLPPKLPSDTPTGFYDDIMAEKKSAQDKGPSS